MSERICIIADHRLLLLDSGTAPGRAPQEITSPFAQDLLDRQEQRRQRDDWKQGSAGWNSGNPAAAFGLADMNLDQLGQDAPRPIRFTSAAPAGVDRLLYTLETDAIGGLFAYTPSAREEQRLSHRAEYRVRDLSVHPDSGRIACSVAHADGTAGLATARANGTGLTEVTEGDAVDAAPAWAPGWDARLAYHSAGFARDRNGHAADQSPHRIELLDLNSGHHEVLAEDDAHDCLAPAWDSAGGLYYIRRPYRPLHRPGRDVRQTLMDFVCFPWRLALGIVGFLNAFTLIFGKKPLITASGPRKTGPSPQRLHLYGRLVEADQKLKRGADDGPTRVPDSWQLVHRDVDGGETVLASAVAHFALTPVGDLVYTDGRAVRRRALNPSDTANDDTVLYEGRQVERVVVLGDPEHPV